MGEKKNSHIHITLEIGRYNKLKREAEEKGIFLSELVRIKLSEPIPNEAIILVRKFMEVIKSVQS